MQTLSTLVLGDLHEATLPDRIEGSTRDGSRNWQVRFCCADGYRFMYAMLHVNFHICRYDDGSEVPLCRPFECHILLPGNKKVLTHIVCQLLLTFALLLGLPD